MKIGLKARYLLELLGAFGESVLDGTTTLPVFSKAISCSNEENFQRRAQLLEQKGLINAERSKWALALTREGKSAIGQSYNPEQEWTAPWDGQWRLFAFDMPQDKGKERQALRQWLKQRRLGKLQGSVWITHRELGEWKSFSAEQKIDPDNVTLFVGRAESERNSAYVDKAWPWQRINESYEAYLKFISHSGSAKLGSEKFPAWFRHEVDLWKKAFDSDPLLPQSLWTSGFSNAYKGEIAYKARQHAYNYWRKELTN